MPGRILVIDDEERYAQMLRDLLDDNDFSAEYSTDPEIALERVRREQFDLVVTDYKMPNMDGAEFLIRSRKTNPDLPVIIVSGLMNMPELIKVANIGVTLVLEKPFDTEDFIQQVSRFVEPRSSGKATLSDFLLTQEEDDDSSADLPPDACKRFVARGAATRKVMSRLYSAIHQRNILFVEARVDSDWIFLGSECARWRGQTEPEKNLLLPLGELAVEGFREEAFEDILSTRGTQWVAIETGDRPNNRIKEELTAALLALEEAGLTGDGFVYVFQIPLGFSLQLTEAPTLVPLLSRMEEPVVLPQFKDRVEDLAGYLSDERNGPIKWEEDAAHLALNYQWDGEYKEIKAVLQKLKNSIGDTPVSLQGLHDVLISRPGNTGRLPDFPGMESFLQRRQAEFIEDLGHSLGNWKMTLSRLGFEDSVFSDVERLDRLPLLYPELLSRDPSAKAEA